MVMSDETRIVNESGLDLFVRLRAPWLLLKLNFCNKLNEILKGGIVKGEITELVGSLAVGKTQVCLSVVASILCNEKDLNTFVVYIDTNGSFRSSRLVKILAGYKVLEPDAVKLLSRVLVCGVFDEDELKQVLSDILERKEEISLVVIDSIGAALSQTTVNYLEGGREVQEEIIARLHCLIDKLNCAVLTTNHFVYWKKRPTPSLGKKWLNAVHSRYLLAKLPNCWYMQMIHSRRYQVTDERVLYSITDRGIEEVADKSPDAERSGTVEAIISQNLSTVLQIYSQDVDDIHK